MKLADLEPTFVRLDNPADKHSHFGSSNRAEAHGVMFYCPKCNGARAHYIICWIPAIPAHIEPGPGRWTFSGSSLADLTLSPSVVVNACGAHFFVRNGAIINC